MRPVNSACLGCEPEHIDFFSGDTVTAFEREVTLKGGEIAKLAITLTPAAPVKVAPAPPPPAPVAPPAPAAGPVGQPQLGSLSKVADQYRNTKERREVILSCSGNTRNMLLALTDEQPQRIYDTAESTFYVLSGQGAAIIGKIQSVITTGHSFPSRGHPFVLARQAIILIVVDAERRAVRGGEIRGMSATADRQGVIVSCPSCGRSNRLRYNALGKASRCGNCRANLPALSEPIEIGGRGQLRCRGRGQFAAAPRRLRRRCGPCRMVAPELERGASQRRPLSGGQGQHGRRHGSGGAIHHSLHPHTRPRVQRPRNRSGDRRQAGVRHRSVRKTRPGRRNTPRFVSLVLGQSFQVRCPFWSRVPRTKHPRTMDGPRTTDGPGTKN